MDLALSIFTFPHNETHQMRCTAYRYLFMFLNKQRKVNHDTLTSKVVSFLKDEMTRPLNNPILLELLDILLTFAPKEGKIALDKIRELNTDNTPPKKIHKTNIVIKDVFSDSQNVHNTTINNSCNTAVDRLYELAEKDINTLKVNFANDIKMNKWFILEHIEKILSQDNPNPIIAEIMSYFKTNIGVFGTKRITLETIFISLFIWINKNGKEHKAILYDRMIQEFESMHNKCSSGHMSRLINVIQGYTTDPKLCITISDIDRYTSIISNYINKQLQETTNEDVLNGICDHNEVYIKFIKSIVNDKIEEWSKEVSINEIHAIVNKHLYYDVYSDKPIKKRVSYCGIM